MVDRFWDCCLEIALRLGQLRLRLADGRLRVRSPLLNLSELHLIQIPQTSGYSGQEYRKDNKKFSHSCRRRSIRRKRKRIGNRSL